jgi:hypothetical protein
MKKSLTLLLLICSISAFAQYPLPNTKVNDTLTVVSALGIGTNTPTAMLTVNGSTTITGNNSRFQNSDDLFYLSELFGVAISGFGAQMFTASDSTSWVFMKVSDDSNLDGDTSVSMGYIDINTFYEMYYEVSKDYLRTFVGDEDGGVGYAADKGEGSMYFYANSSLDFDTPNKTIQLFDNGNISIDVDGSVLNITDGNQAAGYVLTSDASGNASWATTNHNTLDAAYDQGGSGVGRTITADNGAVKIEGADGLLVTGTFGSGAATEISGAGTRMFFNPAKAAFRAGYVDGAQWDDANIGTASIAIGSETTASGTASIAIGNETTASGTASIAIGNETTASGTNSTSMGFQTTAESSTETAIGIFNTDYTPTSTSAWSATDRLFVIGNGQSSGTRADALIITKDGNLTMPTTTGAFKPPVLTTTQRNALASPAFGMIIANSTTGKPEFYDGSAWNALY